MYIPVPTEGGEFENAPVGTHLATCYRFVDLGTQKSTYNGKEREQHKVLISWELHNEARDDGSAFVIGSRYTWSMHEKSQLRKDLESWRGKPFADADFGGPPNGFNIRKILGIPCILTITHKESNGKTYANITGIGKLMKGMAPPPAPENAIIYFSLDEKEFDPVVFGVLSDGLKNVIRQSPEYFARTAPPQPPAYDVSGHPVAHATSLQPAPAPAIPMPNMQHPKQQIARPQMADMAPAARDDMNDAVPF